MHCECSRFEIRPPYPPIRSRVLHSSRVLLSTIRSIQHHDVGDDCRNPARLRLTISLGKVRTGYIVAEKFAPVS